MKTSTYISGEGRLAGSGRFAAALSFAVLAFNIALSGQSHAQTTTRDLTLYEKAGPYNLRLLATDADTIKGEIREFLWEHWYRHRRGHLVVNIHSIEGEPSTSSYFIEPDKDGNWYIAVRIDRVRYDRRPFLEAAHRREAIRETVEYAVYFAERIEVPSDGLTRRIIIPQGETRSPQSYRLRLKDKNKKVLIEL